MRTSAEAQRERWHRLHPEARRYRPRQCKTVRRTKAQIAADRLTEVDRLAEFDLFLSEQEQRVRWALSRSDEPDEPEITYVRDELELEIRK